jgi:hypothetical protein
MASGFPFKIGVGQPIDASGQWEEQQLNAVLFQQLRQIGNGVQPEIPLRLDLFGQHLTLR